ncbi:MAG: plasmid pRiA4b ORF-3 family protein [Verrucomicrobia bacterium]|nr:plasmid pRiA4b ORF-3 family protein [Verrucomicrobiota bacterium]
MNFYQLQVKLLNIKPPVVRVLRTPGDISLGDLHRLIQNAMPWEFSHLHEFSTMDGDNFGPVGGSFAADEFGDAYDESTVILERLLEEEGDRLYYVYDFGDSWEHLITVEKITVVERGKREAVCLSGEGACPPEDCGGIPGYENLVAAMADKEHPEREDLLDWLGEEFDPRAFDLNDTNQRVRKVKL